MEDYILETRNIRKEFPGIVANDDITLQLKKGEIHALLGENGAKEHAKQCIEEAKKCLGLFPDGDAKNALLEYCDYILVRKK